jgi:hypothetical protein
MGVGYFFPCLTEVFSGDGRKIPLSNVREITITHPTGSFLKNATVQFINTDAPNEITIKFGEKVLFNGVLRSADRGCYGVNAYYEEKVITDFPPSLVITRWYVNTLLHEETKRGLASIVQYMTQGKANVSYEIPFEDPPAEMVFGNYDQLTHDFYRYHFTFLYDEVIGFAGEIANNYRANFRDDILYQYANGREFLEAVVKATVSRYAEGDLIALRVAIVLLTVYATANTTEYAWLGPVVAVGRIAEGSPGHVYVDKKYNIYAGSRYKEFHPVKLDTLQDVFAIFNQRFVADNGKTKLIALLTVRNIGDLIGFLRELPLNLSVSVENGFLIIDRVSSINQKFSLPPSVVFDFTIPVFRPNAYEVISEVGGLKNELQLQDEGAVGKYTFKTSRVFIDASDWMEVQKHFRLNSQKGGRLKTVLLPDLFQHALVEFDGTLYRVRSYTHRITRDTAETEMEIVFAE